MVPASGTRALSTAALDLLFKREAGYSYGSVQEPARQVSWFYSCLSQVSQAFAQLPPKLWTNDPRKRGHKPGYRQVFKHPLEARIERPMPYMDGMSWREHWAAILWDQGDVFCVADSPGVDGIPRALMLFGRDMIRPVRDTPRSPLRGWEFKPQQHQPGIFLSITEVMHWRLPNPYDDVMGLAPKDALRMALDADFARSVYDKSFYQNGANPSAILKYKMGELDPEQRAEVRQAWEEYHQGPGKAGRVAILGGDWDFTTWSFQHSQAQHIESRKLSREEIASAFMGFPVEFLNAQEGGGLSRAGEEVARKKLYENCVFPMVRRFEPEFNWGFIQRVDPRILFAFDTRMTPVALDYANTESQIYSRYFLAGIARNEIIEALDLSFDPSPDGDTPLVQSQMVPLGAVSDGETLPNNQPSEPKQIETTDPTQDPTEVSSKDARVRLLTQRLREKTKRILYGIRQVATRSPAQAAAGATDKQWREWARLVLPVIAAGVSVGSDESGDLTDEDLDALQASADGIAFAQPSLERACQTEAQRLLGLFDRTLREAGRAVDARGYCGQLDQAAKVIAQRAVHAAIEAGHKTMMRAVEAA